VEEKKRWKKGVVRYFFFFFRTPQAILPVYVSPPRKSEYFVWDNKDSQDPDRPTYSPPLYARQPPMPVDGDLLLPISSFSTPVKFTPSSFFTPPVQPRRFNEPTTEPYHRWSFNSPMKRGRNKENVSPAGYVLPEQSPFRYIPGAPCKRRLVFSRFPLSPLEDIPRFQVESS